MNRAAAPLAALYAAVLVWRSRGIGVDYWDGFLSLTNALRLWRLGGPAGFTVTRPPVGWLLLSPVAALAARSGGPAAAIEACHLAMAPLAALVAYVSYRFYARLFSAPAAAFAAAALALNPIVLRYAPFALFDIFSALAIFPFLWAGWRYCERPGVRSFALVAAAFALAALTRYQFLMLAAVPFVYAAWMRDFKRAAPLVLLPPLGAAACVLALWVLSCLALGDPPLYALRRTAEDFTAIFTVNLGKQPAPWHVYLAALWEQLGPGLFLAMMGGIWSWLRGGREERYLAASLLVPLVVLSAIANKEERYVISFLPLVYGAVAAGLDAGTRAALHRRFPAGAILVFCAPLLFPWGATRAAWRFLGEDSSLRGRAAQSLGAVLDAAAGPGTCVGWRGPELILRPSIRAAAVDEQMPMFGAPNMGFYTKAEVVELSPGKILDCKPVLFVDVSPDSASAVVSGGKARWEFP